MSDTFAVVEMEGSSSVVVSGSVGPPGLSSTGYIHHQDIASTVWTINHNLGKFPTVDCFDSAGDVIEGVPNHESNLQLTITFLSSTGGIAYIN